MFDKLRLNMAVRNSVTLGTVLIVLLVLIFLGSLFQLSNSIDDHLEQISNLRVYSVENNAFYRIGDDKVYSEYGKYSINIFVNSDGSYIVSNPDFYDTETLSKFISSMPKFSKNSSATGRCSINGNHMAYSITYDKYMKTYSAFIYDYTGEGKSLIELAITIFIIGLAGLIGIVFYSFKIAEKNVMPIENTFNKQKELIGNASHELKTPLTIISTNLSILGQDIENLPPEDRKWINGINTQVKRLNNLVVEMLDLAKMDNLQNAPINTQVSLTDIAQRVALEMEVVAFEHEVNMQTEIAPNVKMGGIESSIEKLIYILIDNAIKYTDKGGMVTLKAGYEKKHPVLKVKNTGQGINKNDIDKLFDRFYRVNKSHNDGANTKSFGLGLAIAKSIVDGHQGVINVDSEINEYTEFCVTFPVFK